jgi:2-polyprenyl-6-methoxyphenol hydroxylase-like FAD-dependent oxidoreductase
MSKTIAIVGAGICGLGASLALARKGHNVRVFERDGAPPEGGADAAFFDWDRRGAGQFRHPHAFLGLLCNILQDNYPDLLQDFVDAGALRVDFEEMIPPELKADYQPEPGDERLWVMMCRRATMETVLRRYVERQPGIEIVNDQSVTGLLTETREGALVATGLELTEGFVSADLVVDASGRTSKFPTWFKNMGLRVREEKDDAEIVYFTRHYRLKTGVDAPPRDGPERSAGDLGYLKYGVFPGEDRHFAVIICVPANEIELRKAVNSAEQFDQICRAIPGLMPWVDSAVSDATTDSFGFGDIHAHWRYYSEDEQPLALNFFAIGDAAIRTNPLYGRGCSIGMKHAHLLADVIEREQDPVRCALQFEIDTQEQIRPIFDASLNEDRKGIKRAAAVRSGQSLERAGGIKKWFGLAFGDAMAGAMQSNIHVIRGLMRTVHLLEAPGAFLKEKRIRNTIFWYMLRGRRKNAAANIVNGPDRLGMHAVLAQNAD